MSFLSSIPLCAYVLLGAALLLTAVCAAWQWLRSARLARFVRQEQERDYLPDEQLPAVSVVVYAHNDADHLHELLPAMLEQDYPDYEVVVVDDGSSDESRDLLSDMMPRYSRLRYTFSPDDTRSLSRKKLSLMIGIKSARNPVIVTTNANVRVTSDQWLRTLMRNFVPSVDVVLGYSHLRYRKDCGLGRHFRVFDSVTGAMQWLLPAFKGHPYRGVSDNLAFRRQLFFDHNGYSASLDLRWGDDDVWVSQVATPDNTRVELAPESQVKTVYDDVAHSHRVLKLRRDFTLRHVGTRRPFVTQAVFSWLNYARLLCLLCAVAVACWLNPGLPAVLAVAGAALALLIVGAVLHIVAFNHARVLLQAPGLTLSVPLFHAWRPVVNLCYKLRGMRTRQSNYTSIYD